MKWNKDCARAAPFADGEGNVSLLPPNTHLQPIGNESMKCFHASEATLHLVQYNQCLKSVQWTN